MEKIPMTIGGFHTLQEELSHLKNVERPAIIKAISDAREHGDLSENAEYHSAKERQGFNEGRIAEIEDKVSRAEVIDVSKLSGDTIKFGATVTLTDDDSGEEIKYHIVGSDESNIKEKKLSITSPLGRALIGKGFEDQVEVVTPNGGKAYTVEKVEYISF